MVSRRKATVFWQNCRTCASREATGGAGRVDPATSSAHTCLGRPTTGVNEEEDAGSSVSEATAVGIGLRADLGTRMQARARELEDEVSRFCADSANRITVSARNYIMTRVFELVSLCSDMRADAATERGAALALQGAVGGRAPGDRRPAEAGVGGRTTPWLGDVLGGLAAVPAGGPAAPMFPGRLVPRRRWMRRRRARRLLAV
ncbi:hypothetical protein MTO96_036558 [Rhipicephalus appendiculatus]